MRNTVETYIGVIIITTAGIVASAIIIHVASVDASIITPTGTALNYLPF